MKNEQNKDLSNKDQTIGKSASNLKAGAKPEVKKSSLKDDKDLGTKRDERNSSRDADRDSRGSSHKGW